MGILSRIGHAISNGVSAAGHAAASAGSWVATQAQRGYNTVRRGVVRGELWVEGAAAGVWDFTHWVNNEKFPDHFNYEVFDRAGPPMPAAGAWAAPGGPSTLSPAERSFLYLDVGRWGGTHFHATQRDFGIVCGRTAVLCAFRSTVPSKGHPPNTLHRPEIDHINALLDHLGSGSLGPVTVRRFDTARTLLPGNADVSADRIFVIVGDMHLPVITRMADTFGERWGRQPGNDASDGLMVLNDSIDWFRKYNGADMHGVKDHEGADIFEEAGADLTEFTRLLNGFRAHPLHLLQLGDMVDLWIGLERFYVEHPSRVVLDTTRQNPDAVSWVNHWVNKTLNGTSQSEHIKRFLGFNNGRKNWLYGNHDCYLGAHNPTTLQTLSGGLNRTEHFDESHVYATHGHRWDSHNRDGATSGQSITQLAFSHPAIRSVEPGGRRDSMVGATELFLSREGSQPFCVFGMGHTHRGLLTRITILNRT